MLRRAALFSCHAIQRAHDGAQARLERHGSPYPFVVSRSIETSRFEAGVAIPSPAKRQAPQGRQSAHLSVWRLGDLQKDEENRMALEAMDDGSKR